ncbi:MAG TPA: hypothetical protein VHM70_08225, partial [Polyangiaceae bacterium]|nr:hypothetical protein [Polyangiaceae bacterium]
MFGVDVTDACGSAPSAAGAAALGASPDCTCGVDCAGPDGELAGAALGVCGRAALDAGCAVGRFTLPPAVWAGAIVNP